MEEKAKAALVAETCRAGNLSEQDWGGGVGGRAEIQLAKSRKVGGLCCSSNLYSCFLHRCIMSQELVLHLRFEAILVYCLEMAKVVV